MAFGAPPIRPFDRSEALKRTRPFFRPLTLLVLALDRDNDFGAKLGIVGPLVGRAACLDAATRLALADPEESDANALFAAVKEHDERVARGEEVEVALLLGSVRVGPESDAEIVRGLGTVIASRKPSGAVVVTDGAEDEDAVRLVRAHLPIVAVRRVVIGQHAGLEAFLVALSKGLDSPKVQRRYVFPFLAFLVVFGVLAAFGWLAWAFAATALAFALFLVVRIAASAIRRT